MRVISYDDTRCLLDSAGPQLTRRLRFSSVFSKILLFAEVSPDLLGFSPGTSPDIPEPLFPAPCLRSPALGSGLRCVVPVPRFRTRGSGPPSQGPGSGLGVQVPWFRTPFPGPGHGAPFSGSGQGSGPLTHGSGPLAQDTVPRFRSRCPVPRFRPGFRSPDPWFRPPFSGPRHPVPASGRRSPVSAARSPAPYDMSSSPSLASMSSGVMQSGSAEGRNSGPLSLSCEATRVRSPHLMRVFTALPV